MALMTLYVYGYHTPMLLPDANRVEIARKREDVARSRNKCERKCWRSRDSSRAKSGARFAISSLVVDARFVFRAL
jgi:hypothetical protein